MSIRFTKVLSFLTLALLGYGCGDVTIRNVRQDEPCLATDPAIANANCGGCGVDSSFVCYNLRWTCFRGPTCSADGGGMVSDAAVVPTDRPGTPADVPVNGPRVAGAACRNGRGACARDSVWTPFNGQLICPIDPARPLGTPTMDVCDGVDNDCNGRVDEGCPCVFGTTQQCNVERNGVGICRAGTQTCGATGWSMGCSGTVLPAVSEICGNGVDDDCDGQTDNKGCI